MQQLRTQLLDASVGGTGEQIIRLRNIANRRHTGAREAVSFAQKSPADRIDNARSVATALQRFDEHLRHRLRWRNRDAPLGMARVSIVERRIVHPFSTAQMFDGDCSDGDD